MGCRLIWAYKKAKEEEVSDGSNEGVWTRVRNLEEMPPNLQNKEMGLEVESAMVGDHTPMLKSVTWAF